MCGQGGGHGKPTKVIKANTIQRQRGALNEMRFEVLLLAPARDRAEDDRPHRRHTRRCGTRAAKVVKTAKAQLGFARTPRLVHANQQGSSSNARAPLSSRQAIRATLETPGVPPQSRSVDRL